MIAGRDGRARLYAADGKLSKQITDGRWDVRSIDGVDEAKGLIYFTGMEHSPIAEHAYRIKLDEFRRLAQDFEEFLRNGEPTHGVYICHTVHGDPELKTPKETFLNFEEIAAIA